MNCPYCKGKMIIRKSRYPKDEHEEIVWECDCQVDDFEFDNNGFFVGLKKTANFHQAKKEA